MLDSGRWSQLGSALSVFSATRSLRSRFFVFVNPPWQISVCPDPVGSVPTSLLAEPVMFKQSSYATPPTFELLPRNSEA